MSSPRRIYWDTSCFICFLNKDERDRRLICEDVLKHANLGDIEIWISTWVIVEVIRPKRAGNSSMPDWALQAIAAVPDCRPQLEELWRRYQRSAPAQKLTPSEIDKIESMFQWPFLKKIYVDERIAAKAVELVRDFGLKPGDGIHAASAILTKCDVLQRWDKDFDRIRHLIPSEEPMSISPQTSLAFDATPESSLLKTPERRARRIVLEGS